jgi:hypothetical protein
MASSGAFFNKLLGRQQFTPLSALRHSDRTPFAP